MGQWALLDQLQQHLLWPYLETNQTWDEDHSSDLRCDQCSHRQEIEAGMVHSSDVDDEQAG